MKQLRATRHTTGSSILQANKDWSVSILGFGHPSDPQTFSGYSRHLTNRLRDEGRLAEQYDGRILQPFDVLSGSFGILWKRGRPAIAIRRDWLWREHTQSRLTRRLERMLDSRSHSGDILQIGTLLDTDSRFGRHFMLTDMTIPQAAEAGHFAVSRLPERLLTEAICVQRRLLHRADHLFTLTNWAKNSIISDFGVPEDKITTVYIGSNLNINIDMTIERKPHQILFVGIDWIRKGGPYLLDGFRELRRRIPEARLVIVGCSPCVEEPGVEVVGYLSPRVPTNRTRIARLMSESGMFCMLSEFEPLGNVFIESFAAALPVVAFDHGSRREIIEHERTGLLVSDRRPETIADALERLIRDPDLARRMGQCAKERSTTRFSWHTVVDRIGSVVCTSNSNSCS